MANSKDDLKKHLDDTLLNKVDISVKVFTKYTIKRILRKLNGYKKLTEIKNSKIGRQALLISNGPSANKLDFNKVRKLQKDQKIDVFALNSFIDDFEVHKLVPNFYMLCDPIFFGEKYSQDRYPVNKYDELKLVEQMEHDLIHKIPAETTIFVPFSQYRDAKDLPNKIIPFCDEIVKFGKSISPTRPTPLWPLAAMHMLRLATYMNYGKIMLIGFDQTQYRSYQVDSKNKISSCSNYAFNEKRTQQIHVEYSSMKDVFFEQYMIHRAYSLFNQHSIENLDLQSELAFFPKVGRQELVYDENT